MNEVFEEPSGIPTTANTMRITPQTPIFSYDQSTFYCPVWPNISDLFDLSLYWASVVRGDYILYYILCPNVRQPALQLKVLVVHAAYLDDVCSEI